MRSGLAWLLKLTKNPERVLRYYFSALSGYGMAGFIWLALIPSDPKSDIFFGFSPFRLLLMGIQVLLFSLFFLAARNGGLFKFLKSWISIRLDEQGKGFYLMSLFLLYCFAFSITFILFIPIVRNGIYLSYYYRLLPLATWILFLSVTTPLCLLILTRQRKPAPLPADHSIFKSAVLILFGLLAIWAFIRLTGLGTIPDPSYWDDHKPVPILEGQLFLVFWVAALITPLIFILGKKISSKTRKANLPGRSGWLDLGIFLIIWLSAFWIWMQQPVPNSYFTPPVKPPNYEVYPYSDARIHDSDALGILLGEVNSSGRIIRRPLYAVFLAGLHGIAGNEYSSIILLQTVILALVPAILYQLMKKLGIRSAGVLLAIFTILIELNTLQVSSLTTTSNTKILMTEWPTMLLLVCLVFSLMSWSGKKGNHNILSLVIGGLLGALILLRSQCLVLIPFILIIFILKLRKDHRKLLLSSLVFGLGIALMIIPLLMRNWQIIGKITFEDPRYTQAVIQRFENQETVNGLSQQETLDESNSDLFGSAIRFMLKNPVQYIGFMTNNFLHNEVLDIFILPVRSTPVEGLANLFTPKDLFWLDEKNDIQFPQMLLIVTYLFIFGIGLATAWKKWNLTGMIPFIIHLAYNFSNSVSRISGWRFILPVQWIIIAYFSIGLVVIMGRVLQFFGLPGKVIFLTQKSNANSLLENENQWIYFQPKFSLTLLAIFLIGIAIPGLMQWTPVRYLNQDRSALIQELNDDQRSVGDTQLKKDMDKMLQDDHISLIKGEAFYPRFYAGNDGEPGLNPGIYRSLPYSRLVFLLIGAKHQELLLSLKASPEYFPNGAEVIVVGRQNADGFETLFVDVRGNRSMIYQANSIP
jgi:hypothetical protein